jgi:very-short-patch-repair endonuclease
MSIWFQAFIDVVIVGAVIVLVLVAVIIVKLRVTRTEEWPFYVRKPLSSPEQILYFRLCKALPEYIVLAQVQLSRFLGVKRGYSYQAWMNRINRMSADFVVCSKDSRIVAVIELDDRSHESDRRRKADVKKDKALSCAGIRVLRWQAKAMPDEVSIRTQLYEQRS